jgi:regulator of sigma E protease
MNLLSTLAAFALALGTLIVFHEFGHYFVARLCGVRVLRFSLGFGRPVWSRRLGRDGTEWAIGAFPLGGYVKMLDERESPVPAQELHRAFNRQNVWRRTAIVAAGPIANFLLAILLYWVMFVHGVPGVRPAIGEAPADTPAAIARIAPGELVTRVAGEEVRTWQELRWRLLEHVVERGTVTIETESLNGEIHERRLDLRALDDDALDTDFLTVLGLVPYQPPVPPVIGRVVDGSPAQAGGLQEGDEVLSIDGRPVELWQEMVREIRARPGAQIALDVVRDGQRRNVVVTASDDSEGGVRIGRIGIGPKNDPGTMRRYQSEVRHGPLEAVGVAIGKTWEASRFTLEMMWKMVRGQLSIKNLSGPLTIADYAGQSAQMGWLPYVSFVALVSISLGVLNLLPVPLLDGGHLMYYALEIFKGSPVSERTLEIGQRIGMFLLMTLMAFAIYNDIQRLFGGS